MSPTAGLGAQCAMNDAVILANHINTIHSNELRDVKRALKGYRRERYPHGKKDVEGSARMSSYVKNVHTFLFIACFIVVIHDHHLTNSFLSPSLQIGPLGPCTPQGHAQHATQALAFGS